MSSHLPRRVELHEWIIVGTAILLCFACLLLSVPWQFDQLRKSAESSNRVGKVDVNISGEISNPGTYTVNIGATLGQLLDMASPTVFADLSDKKRREKLTQDKNVHIARLPCMTVDIIGGVSRPGPHTIPVGLSLCRIEKYVKLSEDADREWLRKRRRKVLAGSQINIPVSLIANKQTP